MGRIAALACVLSLLLSLPCPAAATEPSPADGAAAQAETAADMDAGRVPYTDPEQYDMTVYDTSPILDAWQARDPSGLGEYDRAIYDGAERVLSQVLADGMTDLEKERAIYAWVTWSIDYDWAQTDPLAVLSRDSFTPYGGLVTGQAVCLGVAASFELLMDMAGVECITVVGAAYESREDHAWNMVRLDGTWTCADPTWDLYATRNPERELALEEWGQEQWVYFNVDSGFMAETDHQWDRTAVPAC